MLSVRRPSNLWKIYDSFLAEALFSLACTGEIVSLHAYLHRPRGATMALPRSMYCDPKPFENDSSLSAFSNRSSIRSFAASQSSAHRSLRVSSLVTNVAVELLSLSDSCSAHVVEVKPKTPSPNSWTGLAWQRYFQIMNDAMAFPPSVWSTACASACLAKQSLQTGGARVASDCR